MSAKDAALRDAEARLAALQADFDYNLGLLEGRDTDLAAAEAALQAAGGELGAKRELVAQMRAALAEAEQGARAGSAAEGAGPAAAMMSAVACVVRLSTSRRAASPLPPPAALTAEHTARTAAEKQLVQQRQVLVAELQQVRAAGESALRQLQHQTDAQLRQAEAAEERRAVAVAEKAAAAAAAHQEEVQRLEVRWEHMGAGRWGGGTAACGMVRVGSVPATCQQCSAAPLTLHTQAEHARKVQELKLRAEVAEQLVLWRDAEMATAHEALRVQAAQLAVGASAPPADAAIAESCPPCMPPKSQTELYACTAFCADAASPGR